MVYSQTDSSQTSQKKKRELVNFFISRQENILRNGHTKSHLPNIDVNTLNALSDNEKSVKIILNALDYNVMAITKNVETVFGIDLVGKGDIGKYMTTLKPDHIEFIMSTIQWYNTLFSECGIENAVYFKTVICGLTSINDAGQENRLLIRTSRYSHDGTIYPNIIILSVEKINYIMKSDIAWSRVTYGNDVSKIAHTSTQELTGRKQDILSSREKEVLTCLASGMDTNEIAQTLFISHNTIIKHRKNMLARTGLCDTTALIHICQAADILV